MNPIPHLYRPLSTLELEEEEFDLRVYQFKVFFDLVDAELIVVVTHGALWVVSGRSIEEIIPTELLIVFGQVLWKG